MLPHAEMQTRKLQNEGYFNGKKRIIPSLTLPTGGLNGHF